MTGKERRTDFRPLVPRDWENLEQLFGRHGASEGCWCMWWRQTQAEFNSQHGEKNRLAFKSLVESGAIPGLVAYRDGEPVGWCAVEPRESYPRLDRSRILARVDDRPVWSITCFYVKKQHRGTGLMRSLLNASTDWAAKNGACIIEAYPIEAKAGVRPSAAYMGVVPLFLEAGFGEVVRRSPRRPVMRKLL